MYNQLTQQPGSYIGRNQPEATVKDTSKHVRQTNNRTPENQTTEMVEGEYSTKDERGQVWIHARNGHL